MTRHRKREAPTGVASGRRARVRGGSARVVGRSRSGRQGAHVPYVVFELQMDQIRPAPPEHPAA